MPLQLHIQINKSPGARARIRYGQFGVFMLPCMLNVTHPRGVLFQQESGNEDKFPFSSRASSSLLSLLISEQRVVFPFVGPSQNARRKASQDRQNFYHDQARWRSTRPNCRHYQKVRAERLQDGCNEIHEGKKEKWSSCLFVGECLSLILISVLLDLVSPSIVVKE